MMHPIFLSAALALLLLVPSTGRAQDPRLSAFSGAITTAEQYEKQGKRREAATEYEKACKLAVQIWGNNNGTVAALSQAQGLIWKELGNYAKAEELITQALDISSAIGDTEFAAEAVNNLATLKWELADFVEAQRLHERGLAMLTKSYGENSPLAAVSRNNLAEVYKELGDYSRGEPMVLQSIKTLRSNQPKYASELASSLMNLADFNSRQGNFPRAELLLLESIQINEKAFGTNHLQVCRARNNLAALYLGWASSKKPNRCISRILKSSRQRWVRTIPVLLVSY